MKDFLTFSLNAISDPEGAEKDRLIEKRRKDFDILIHIFMLGSLTPKFVRWINNRIEKNSDKYYELYLNSKYRYNMYLRGTTPSRYKNIRNIISVSEELPTNELAIKLLENSDGTTVYKKLKTFDDWLRVLDVPFTEFDNEKNLTLAYCYRAFIQNQDMCAECKSFDEESLQNSFINHFILDLLAKMSAEHKNEDKNVKFVKEVKDLVKTITESNVHGRSLAEMGDAPREMALKAISMYNIPPTDFESIGLNKNHIYQLAYKAHELKNDELEFAKEDGKNVYSEEFKRYLRRFERNCMYIGVISIRLAELYSEARKRNLEYMDTADEYHNLISKYKSDLSRLSSLEAQCKDKQNNLNTLQIKYNKMEKTNAELALENEFLQNLLVRECNDDIENVADVPYEHIDNNKEYPSTTLLFGGHPNWQRKFIAIYPNIKAFSGVDNTFPDNIFSDKVSCVILNSRYMSHSVFYKLKKLQKKYHFTFEYIY